MHAMSRPVDRTGAKALVGDLARAPLRARTWAELA